MKNKLHIITFNLLIILIGSCCKEKPKTQQSTKVKSIFLTYAGNPFTYKYFFYYDSVTNQINKVAVDTFAYFTMSKINNNTIKIVNVDDNKDSSISYVHLNTYNKIICWNTSENEISTDADSYYASYSNEYADTILEPDYLYALGGYYISSDVSMFDFTYNNENCITSKVASTNIFNSDPSNPTYDTFSLEMTYNTSLLNNHLIPMQNSNIRFRDVPDYINLFYVLGLNGYYFIKPNKNLLQTKQFIFGTTGRSNLYYEYKTDTKQNITEMCIRVGSTTIDCDKFIFEYY